MCVCVCVFFRASKKEINIKINLYNYIADGKLIVIYYLIRFSITSNVSEQKMIRAVRDF